MMEVSNTVANSANFLVVCYNVIPETRTSFQNILSSCKYKVTVCDSYLKALGLLWKNDQRFNIAMVGVEEPDGDTFAFIKVVSSELNLPVIVVSLDLSYKSILLGIQHGCCDYLSPSAFVKAAIVMWQHLIITFRPPVALKDDQPSSRRIVWTDERSEDFRKAIQRLGFQNAVPNKILEIMRNRYPDLTRENIASHLQRYREQMMKRKASSQSGYKSIMNNGNQIQTRLADETSIWKNHLDSQSEEPYNQTRLAGSNVLPLNQYQPRHDSAESIFSTTDMFTVAEEEEEEEETSAVAFDDFLLHNSWSLSQNQPHATTNMFTVGEEEEETSAVAFDDILFPFDHNSWSLSQNQPHATTGVDTWDFSPFQRLDLDTVTMDNDGEHRQEEKASVVSRFRQFCSAPIRKQPCLVFENSQTSLRNGWLDMDHNFS